MNRKNDWVHCNKCILKRDNPDLKFFLAECGHIYCETCVKKMRSQANRCFVCNRSTNVTLLGKEIDPNIKHFFVPIDELSQNVSEVYRFQNMHRNHLNATLCKKYANLKSDYSKSQATLRRVIKENQRLHEIIRSSGMSPSVPPGLLLSSSTPLASHNSKVPQSNMSFTSSSICGPNRGPTTPKLYPGYAQRVFQSGSTLNKPSPSLHRVPFNLKRTFVEPRSFGTMTSMEQLRKGPRPI